MSSGCPTRSDTNRAVQPQRMARGLKFWIEEVEGLYCLYKVKKVLISCVVTAQLNFVFTYAKSWFSHDATHTLMPKKTLRVMQMI